MGGCRGHHAQGILENKKTVLNTFLPRNSMFKNPGSHKCRDT